jgi:GTP-binding protein EngB required for normal cell division
LTPAELLEAFDETIAHGRALGLETVVTQAEDTLAKARSRVGLTGDVYALALVGGTGVGKSTLLNALAGEQVSEASVIRPTTDRPVAWVADSAMGTVAPLLDWLDIEEVRRHDRADFEGVAIVDLPDFDSIVNTHREAVDRLLPRLDAVWWVVDPQKYDDERLFEYLRGLVPRVDAVRVVINKADQLGPAEAEEVSADLTRRLVAVGLGRARVVMVSAASGEGVPGLVTEIVAGAEAKRVIYEKVEADVVAAVDIIARAVGVTDGAEPLLAERRRVSFQEEVAADALGVVDLVGIGDQVTAAYLERAKVSAGSLLSRLGTLIRKVSGVQRRQADPVRYMKRWRERGHLSRAVNTLRQAYLEAASGLPPEARAGILSELDPGRIRQSIETALDGALSRSGSELEIRTPFWWRLMTLIQFVATAGVVVAVLWFLTLWLAPGDLPVGSVELPWLGPVPMPLVLLVGALFLSFLVGGVVRLHAGRLGRRYARRVERSVRDGVNSAVDRHGFDRLATVESHRTDLARLCRDLSRREGLESRGRR